jgi:hypothetical protein
MAVKTYFSSTSDTQLANTAVAKEANLFIQKYEYIGTGVLDLTVPATATLTPAVSPTWVVDSLNSTVANNLVLLDDNGVACSGKIDDTTATAITFDSTACLTDADGTTAGTWTDTNTYSFYALTPSSTAGATYGPYYGYIEGTQFSITDTFLEYKTSIPRKKKFQDLEERLATVTAGHINVASAEVLETIFNADLYGLQTGQVSIGIGSEPDTNKFYRLTFVNADRGGQAKITQLRKCQFKSDGNVLEKSEAGYQMLPFSADVLSDSFYPVTADMAMIIVE